MIFFNKPKPILITNTSELIKVCDRIEKNKIIAVDTEFMRDKTYYPVLCLIQINVDGKCFLIDMLAKDIDSKPILAILINPQICKIFHSARGDLEVMSDIYGQIPQGIADTQIMASLCEFAHNISYSALVEKMFAQKIDKNLQRSDWQKRPLNPDQLKYAALDVFYLPKIYKNFLKILTKQNKLKWFDEEMQHLMKGNYGILKSDLYKNFPLVNKAEKYRHNISQLLLWRNDLAMKCNVPRSFIMKDSLLKNIANSNFKDWGEVEKKYLHGRFIDNKAKERLFIALNNSTHQNEESSDVILIKEKSNFRLNDKQKAQYIAAQNLLKNTAYNYRISPELLISFGDLRKIILGHKEVTDILSGWRYLIFGGALQKLIENSHNF